MSDKIAALEQQLRELPEGPEHLRQRIDLMNEVAWRLREPAEQERLMRLATEAASFARSCGYKRGLAGSLLNIAFSHYIRSDYGPAVAGSLEALGIFDEIGDRRGEAYARTVFGYAQWSLGNYELALEEAFRALRLVEELKEPWAIAWCCVLLGGVQQSLRDYSQALRYYERAHALLVEEKDRFGEARALTGIGSVLQAMGIDDRALECHVRSLEIYRSIQNRLGEARALNDIGEIHQARGELEKAQQLHLESLRLRELAGNPQAATTSLLNLGRLYLTRGETSEAVSALHRALDIADEIGARPKAYQAHQLLSELYERLGDLASAFRHHKAFQRLKEEVFNEEASTKLKNLQISLEVERSQREAEIERLRNVELKAKNEELAGLLDELQATQARLVQSEKMAALGSLVAALAHEINSPLGAIRTASEVSLLSAERILAFLNSGAPAEKLASDPYFRRAVESLRENQHATAEATSRIGRVLESLRSFTRLDRAEYDQLDLNQSLDDILTLLEPDLRGRVQVVRRYGQLPKVACYAAEVNQALMNLVRNAA